MRRGTQGEQNRRLYPFGKLPPMVKLGGGGRGLHNFNTSARGEAVVQELAMRDVAELVGEDMRVAENHIDIAMRVTINPVINIRTSNKIAQLNRECAIDNATLELLGRTLLRRHMMREHNLRICLAILHSLADKIEATFVLGIEIVGCQTMSVVHDPVEITHTSLRLIRVAQLDERPECRDDNIYIAQRDDLVVIRMHVVTDLLAIAVRDSG